LYTAGAVENERGRVAKAGREQDCGGGNLSGITFRLDQISNRSDMAGYRADGIAPET
jgi:hypothetical protein